VADNNDTTAAKETTVDVSKMETAIIDGDLERIQEDGTLKDKEPEANTEEVEQEPDKQPEQAQAPAEPTQVEVMARKHGWTPEDEYTGDSKDWVSAEEYIENQWAINESEKKGRATEKRKYDELLKSIEFIKGKITKDAEAKIATMKAELEQQKTEAIREGDVDEVKSIDKKIGDLEDAAQEDEESENSKTSEPVQAYTDWIKQNDWYESDDDKRELADTFGDSYIAKHPIPKQGMTNEYMENMLNFVDLKLIKFGNKPEKKVTTPVANTQTVQGNRVRSTVTKKHTARELSAEARMRRGINIMTDKKTNNYDNLAKARETKAKNALAKANAENAELRKLLDETQVATSADEAPSGYINPRENLESRAIKGRPKRLPMGSSDVFDFNHLKEDEYKYRIVNDVKDGQRIKKFIEYGWEFVLDPYKQKPDQRAGATSEMGTAVCRAVGGGITAYLMRIPKQWYDEYQQIRQDGITAKEEGLRVEETKPGETIRHDNIDGAYGKVTIG